MPPRPACPLLLSGGLRLRADGQLGAQLQEALLADALNVHQLLDLLERTLRLPVVENARGSLGADAGELLELRGAGGMNVDYRRGFCGRRGRLVPGVRWGERVSGERRRYDERGK